MGFITPSVPFAERWKIIMVKSKLVKANEKIAEKVVNGYKKIEETVVGGYKKIEEGAVNGFTKISDSFVDEFLTKEGETVEEAKARLAAEQREKNNFEGSGRHICPGNDSPGN